MERDCNEIGESQYNNKEEETEEVEGKVGDKEDEDDDEEEEEDDDYEFRFKSGINPLEFVGENASGLQIYQQFERLEYEALAEKKRKALADAHLSEGPAKKARQEDISEATMDEIMQVINFGARRKSKKRKKRGRRKGSRNKLSPEILGMLGDATLHYANGRYKEAISVLNEVVRLAPNLPDSYHTLGLVHKALGNNKIAFEFYMLAGILKPKDSSLWKQLFTWSIEQGNVSQTCYCLSKAITADPTDISLRFHQASLYVELGDHQRAAESYEQIQRLSPNNVEALKSGAKLYQKCGQTERAVAILEDYLHGHPSEVDLGVIDLLVAMLMEINAYKRAILKIEEAQIIYYSEKELPLNLKIKAGICHIHRGDTEKAKIYFSVLEFGKSHDHVDLITEVADTFISLKHFSSALKYYHMLETLDGVDDANLHLKIARCYLSLKERVQAIKFFYKALDQIEDDVDARLDLASLLVEDAKEDEAISLLSSPINLDPQNIDQNPDKSKPWWLDGKIKLKLCHIYRAKGMLEKFVDTILPLVRESLYVESLQLKIKVKKRLRDSVLFERVKKVDDQQTDGVFCGSRPIVTPADRMKASRARKLLQRKAALKEEKKAAAIAAGLDWQSDDANDKSEQEPVKEPPLHNLLRDEEHQYLIIDLCKALASLQRYYEALEIIKLALKSGHNILPVEKEEELRSLGAQMAYNTMDPKHGFDCVKHIVQQHPYSIAAWNCYYKVISRLGKSYSKHSKFLRSMRVKYKDCVPSIVISGHQFTVGCQHQDAAREYLEAYRVLPENPLINLCVGTALINLTLGFRLQNKHQCLAQGLSFLYNNLRLCGSSQEALYNIARAFHHVGLVTLAASYYWKVLAISEKDYPIPKLPNENWDVAENQNHGYCDLRREAAFNLHLIYKRSGALDLARQVLRDHCTLD
ncbi:general transcription factor 3C polypeptide 3 isoform X1 [Herrania umbratica]|uniref:General transcription factor 3C polypeptide 3 isoform X1 n=1 Tax=Herrania umbratica TaxID=108875 RepID=A0A6J1BNY3_9ROSI|nr:general transcription factor 3C polypeptide 3 isoform X1 [Herrania umbratica]